LNREPPEQVAAVCPVTGLARLNQRGSGRGNTGRADC